MLFSIICGIYSEYENDWWSRQWSSTLILWFLLRWWILLSFLLGWLEEMVSVPRFQWFGLILFCFLKFISCNVFLDFCTLGVLILICNEMFTMVSQVLLTLDLCVDLHFIIIIILGLLQLMACPLYQQGLHLCLEYRSDHWCFRWWLNIRCGRESLYCFSLWKR